MSRTYRASIVGHEVDNLALIVGTLHYQTDLTDLQDEPDPDDVAAGVWSTIGAQWLAVTATRVRIDRVDVLEQVIKPDLAVGGTHVVDQLGTLPSANRELPPGLCIGMNVHTNTRSRSSRGFCHLPPPFDPIYSGGPVAAGAYLTNAQTLAAKLDDSFDLGTINVSHVHPVVYSRKRHQEGVTPYTFRVTSGTINPKWRYLRSRETSP